MASITSLGVGSGLDINSIVTQLVAVESQPLALMQSNASALQTKISSYGTPCGRRPRPRPATAARSAWSVVRAPRPATTP